MSRNDPEDDEDEDDMVDTFCSLKIKKSLIQDRLECTTVGEEEESDLNVASDLSLPSLLLLSSSLESLLFSPLSLSKESPFVAIDVSDSWVVVVVVSE